MEKENIAIAKIIHNRRIDLKMPLEELAEACGVSRSTVSRWESGDIRNIKKGHIKILSEKLYIPIDTILMIKSDENIVSADIVLAQRKICKKVTNITDISKLSDLDLFIDSFIRKRKI